MQSRVNFNDGHYSVSSISSFSSPNIYIHSTPYRTFFVNRYKSIWDTLGYSVKHKSQGLQVDHRHKTQGQPHLYVFLKSMSAALMILGTQCCFSATTSVLIDDMEHRVTRSFVSAGMGVAVVAVNVVKATKNASTFME